MRITKSKEERKEELILAAVELFNASGYENTYVSDIVKKVGVAQGTFYYYFESKEEILYSILEDFISRTAKSLEEAIKQQDKTSIEKLTYVFAMFFNPASIGFDVPKELVFLKDEKLHDMLDKVRVKLFLPIFQEIVKQGIEENIFKVRHEREITEILFLGINSFMHNLYESKSIEINMQEKVDAIKELIEKALGLEAFSLKF